MAFLHGPTSMVRFLEFTKSLGKIWPKRNHHAPKSEWDDLFSQYMSKKGSLGKNIYSLIILLSSLVVFFSSQTNISFKFYYNIISMSWAPAFFMLKQHFCLSHHKTHRTISPNGACLKMYHLETSNSTVTLTSFFLGVNRSDPGMSLTSNHRCHKALERLHGPWCKHALIKGTNSLRVVYHNHRGWDKTTRTLAPWRQEFRHPTRNECMGWFAQINHILYNLL